MLPTITPDMVFNHPKSDSDITYLKKKNINKPIQQKQRKKYVYERDNHNIYNLILGQTNEKLRENEASTAPYR